MNPQLMFGSDTNFVAHEERAPGIPVVHLFRQGRAVPTILLWIVFFMSLIDIYLLTSWLPTVFHNAGITLSLAVIATAVFRVVAWSLPWLSAALWTALAPIVS